VIGYEDQKCLNNSWIDIQCWKKKTLLININIAKKPRFIKYTIAHGNVFLCGMLNLYIILINSHQLTCSNSSLVVIGILSSILSWTFFPSWYLVLEIFWVNPLRTWIIQITQLKVWNIYSISYLISFCFLPSLFFYFIHDLISNILVDVKQRLLP